MPAGDEAVTRRSAAPGPPGPSQLRCHPLAQKFILCGRPSQFASFVMGCTELAEGKALLEQPSYPPAYAQPAAPKIYFLYLPIPRWPGGSAQFHGPHRRNRIMFGLFQKLTSRWLSPFVARFSLFQAAALANYKVNLGHGPAENHASRTWNAVKPGWIDG